MICDRAADSFGQQEIDECALAAWLRENGCQNSSFAAIEFRCWNGNE